MNPEESSSSIEISADRGFNQEFTPEQGAGIMAELCAGKAQRQVAANFNTNQPTISKIKKRWETHQNLRPQQRKGRPKKLTALQILRIDSYISRHRNLTWNDVLIELELKRLNSHSTTPSSQPLATGMKGKEKN
ncbi:transposase [Fusarium mundagurra]|uniref:Transposase n=1 Tax=Fusarium mundagurra TaxID=1567541 RepID=A0A8H6D2C0_9HYPO|nr:transposase [Fusarium mundagurra]